MAITEIENISWFERIKGAFFGVLVGGSFFAGSFCLLFWNEGRAVRTAQALEEGAQAVVSADAARVDPSQEGKLVHVTGLAEAKAPLADPQLGASAPALRLRRTVEMYQWTEKKETRTTKNVGGSETRQTTYSYDKGWSERLHDSHDFKETGHDNPAAMPLESADWTSASAVLGARALAPRLLERIAAFKTLAPEPGELERAAAAAPGAWRIQSGRLYRGKESANPEVGDLRVQFEQVPATEISVVSKQLGDGFEPYRARSGSTVELLAVGPKSAAEMFLAAQQSNAVMTWALRGAGFLLMAFGLSMILKPLSVLADILPFVGSLVAAGTGLVSFLIAAALSLVTIALAWVFYRPLVGGALLAAAFLATLAAFKHVRSVPAAAPAAAAPAA